MNITVKPCELVDLPFSIFFLTTAFDDFVYNDMPKLGTLGRKSRNRTRPTMKTASSGTASSEQLCKRLCVCLKVLFSVLFFLFVSEKIRLCARALSQRSKLLRLPASPGPRWHAKDPLPLRCVAHNKHLVWDAQVFDSINQLKSFETR